MKWENKLHWPVAGLIFLFPVIAVSVKDGGSAVFLLLLILGLVFGWPAWKTLEPWEKRVLKGFLGFFAVLLLTIINTEDYASAIRKVERFVRMLAIVPVYLLLRRLRLDAARIVAYGALLGCFVMAGQAWYYANVIGQNPVHGMYHKIVFGDTAVLLAAIVAVAALSMATKWWHYAVAALAILAGLYASLLSMTRGAWLLIPVVVLLWLWLYRKRISTRGWMSIGGGLLAVILVSSVWMPEKFSAGLKQGMAELKAYQLRPDRPTSWGARLNMWQDSITLFKQNPILGIGIGDFKIQRQQLMDAGVAYKDYTYGHAHNIFFHGLATTGLVGFAALIVSIFVFPFIAFYRLWNKASNNKQQQFHVLAGLTVVIAFFVFGLSEGWLVRNPFMNEYLLFTAIFLCGAYLNLNKKQKAAGS